MYNRQGWRSRVEEGMAGLSPETRRWVSVGILIFGVVVALWGARSVYFALASHSAPASVASFDQTILRKCWRLAPPKNRAGYSQKFTDSDPPLENCTRGN